LNTINSTYISKNLTNQALFSTNNQIFHDAPDVVNYIFYVFLNNLDKSINMNLNDMLKLISNSSINYKNSVAILDVDGKPIIEDNGTIDTINFIKINFIEKNIAMFLTNFEKIGLFNDSFILMSNGFYNLINIGLTNNNDIYFYKITAGNPVIGTELETRLLDIISNKPSKFAWTKEIGHNLFKKLQITINCELIDEYNPELLSLNYKLYSDTNQKKGHDILIGNTKDMYIPSIYQKNKKLYIKMPFWFCKNPGTPLPMINLMHSDVYLNGIINDLSELLYIDPDSYLRKIPEIKCQILNKYVYLDEDERKKFSSSKLEYMIEKYNYGGERNFSQNTIIQKSIQDAYDGILNNKSSIISISEIITNIIQNFSESHITIIINKYLNYLEKSEFNTLLSSLLLLTSSSTNEITKLIKNYVVINEINKDGYDPTISIPIKLNGTIKYLIWYVKYFDKTTENSIDLLNWNKFGYNVRDSTDKIITINNTISRMKIKMFGTDRTQNMEETYYTNLMPHKTGGNSLDSGEFLFSFALYPFTFQPTGTANYTEIADSIIMVNFTKEILKQFIMNINLDAKIELWGREITILRIMSGMGGLAFYLNKES
jgi:hypothetical protein